MNKKILILASAETQFLSQRIAKTLSSDGFNIIGFLKHKEYSWRINGNGFSLRGAGMTKYAYFYMLIKTVRIKPDIIHIFDEKLIPHALTAKLMFSSKVIFHFPYKDPIFLSKLLSRTIDYTLISNNHISGSADFLEDYPKFFSAFNTNGIFHHLSIPRSKKKLILQFCTPGTDNTLFLETSDSLRYNPQLHFVLIYRKERPDILKRDNLSIVNATDFSEKKLINWFKDATIGIIPNMDNSFSPESLFYLFCMSSLPVLSSNKEITSLIKKHSSGKVFDTDDKFELAKIILSMIYDHYAYPITKKNCRNAAKTLCWESVENKISDIYRSLI